MQKMINKDILKIVTLIVFCAIQISCNSNVSEAQEMANNKRKNDSILLSAQQTRINIEKLVFASKLDPICGMPITAGVEDTITINTKLYGFCARECKIEFLKRRKTK